MLAPERYSSDIPDRVLGLHAQAVACKGCTQWHACGRRRETVHSLARRNDVAAAAHRAAHRDRAVGETSGRWIAVRADAPPRERARVPGAAADTRRQLLEPRRSLRARVGRPRLERAGARGAPLPAHAWLALPRRRARGGVLALRPHVGLDRARSGVRAERGAVPRGARRARPARAQPLRTSRSGDDARHVRRRRGASLSPIGRAYYRSMYLPPNSIANAAWLETCGSSSSTSCPTDVACGSPTRRRAPGSRPASASPSTGCRRDSGRSRTRSSRTPIRSAPRSTSRGSRSIHSRCGSGCPASAHIASVTVGGRPLRTFDRATGTIDLTGHGNALAVEVAVAR